MAMTNSVLLWILLMVWLVPFALFILLQIFLCRKENKWLGLILPAISFLGSLVFFAAGNKCAGNDTLLFGIKHWNCRLPVDLCWN